MDKFSPLRLNDPQSLINVFESLRSIPLDGREYIVDVKQVRSKRTKKQNNSIHLYCTMLAEIFNNSGLDQKVILGQEAFIPWDTKSVKEKIWHSFQKSLFEKESTSDLETHEVSQVYDYMANYLSEAFDVQLDFPEKGYAKKSN